MIIGVPKLEDYPVLTPQEFAQITGSVQQAIASGATPDQAVNVNIATLGRLIVTITAFSQELKQLKERSNEDADNLPPLPVLRAPDGSGDLS
jgi:hypothetical protein